MTFKELTDWLDVPLTEGDWRQCSAGLGWVHVSAEVAPTSVVMGCVQSKARVGARVVVEDRVVVGCEAVVGDWATLKEGATVCERAKVGERANIGAGACLKTGVTVGEGAYVDAGTVWHQSPLYIIGTKFPVFQPRRGFMQIACKSHELSWWEIHGASFAKEIGFTPSQISEYLSYLELFKSLTES